MSDYHEEEIGEISQLTDGPTLHTTKYETKVPSGHKLNIAGYSIIAALLSVANPFLVTASNSIQSQHLYIGMMLTKGQIPYSDVFTTGGMLYYIIIALSYLFGSTFFLGVVEAIAFFVSGIYFYKLINYFTNNQKLSNAFVLIYFIVMVSVGFGGIYPIQFAMPFVLISLWFLTKYFAGLIKDEAFILFGFSGAVAMLLEPRTLVFWAIALLTIVRYNFKEKHIARGIYQLLAAVFGMLIVFYTVGYFILNMQILGPYLAQAVSYQFSYFKVASEPIWLSVISQLGYAIALGFIPAIMAILKEKKIEEDKHVQWLMVITASIYLGIAMISGSHQLYLLLPMLPFAFIIVSQVINSLFNEKYRKNSHRRSKSKQGQKQVLSLYFSKYFYLPLLVIIIGLVFGGQTYMHNSEMEKGRTAVSNYLNNHKDTSSKIYVWDDSSEIYMTTKSKSASQFASPFVNFEKAKHQQVLVDELLQDSAAYIIVNQDEKVSQPVKRLLSKKYRLIDGPNGKFEIFQKK